MLIIATAILLLGIPLGRILRSFAGKDEIKTGQKYFKAIIALSILGIVISLIFQKMDLTFSFTFILVATRESLY